ncbi:unnamed protein product [Chrysoparadoxa australica]
MACKQLLDHLNNGMHQAGISGEAQLKKRVPGGGLATPSEKDIDQVSMAISLQQAVGVVKHLNKEEKKEWAIKLSKKGNSLYKEGDYKGAMTVYMQCFMGLDLEGSKEAKRSSQQEIQLPVLCNLAACSLALGESRKAVDLCDLALQIDPKCFRACTRKAAALLDLKDVAGAKKEIMAARPLVRGGKQAALLDKYLAQLQLLPMAESSEDEERESEKAVAGAATTGQNRVEKVTWGRAWRCSQLLLQMLWRKVKKWGSQMKIKLG